jgi:hypothetical protein
MLPPCVSTYHSEVTERGADLYYSRSSLNILGTWVNVFLNRAMVMVTGIPITIRALNHKGSISRNHVKNRMNEIREALAVLCESVTGLVARVDRNGADAVTG